MVRIPDAPIPVDGFPQCAVKGCDTECAVPGGVCAFHGGSPATIGMLHRSIHRQIHLCLEEMAKCRTCAHKSLLDVRCTQCAWYRGAAMAMAGIAEQFGWRNEMLRYMDLIAIPVPPTQH